MNRPIIWACALGICSLSSAVAHAQDGRADIARRDLLTRVEAARAAGDHAEALRLGMQAAEIRNTPSLRVVLAQEHQALGHLLAALDQASACVREANADATLRNRDAILATCRSIAAEVEGRLGRIVVEVTPRDATGLRVTVGGADLPRALLGVATPSMPGAVEVRVEAEGMEPTTRTVTLRAGAIETVQLALRVRPADVANATSQANPPSAAGQQAASLAPGAGPLRESPQAPESSSRRTLGWVALSAGALGVGLGVVGAVLRADAVEAYNTQSLGGNTFCPGDSFAGVQPDACQSQLDRGALGSALMWSGLVGGGVLGIVGAVVLATAPSSRGGQQASVRCGGMGVGLQCQGSF